MSQTVTVKVGPDKHEVELSDMTVLIPSANMIHDLEVENYIPLDMEACAYHIDRVQKLHPELEQYIKAVFGDDLHWLAGEFTSDNIRRSGSGMKHVAGRFDLSLKFQDQGIGAIFHKFPEGGLHPGVQGNLVNALLMLQQRWNVKMQAQLAAKLEAAEASDPEPQPIDPAANPMFPKGKK